MGHSKYRVRKVSVCLLALQSSFQIANIWLCFGPAEEGAGDGIWHLLCR